MTATLRLFDQDPYAFEFEARMISTNGRELIMDRTLFFPESGGQPADSGTLNGIEVMDVQERGDQIVHFLAADASFISTVHGRINRERRFDHMQQHTGQHILSQTFIKHLQAETIGFHLGREISTIDVSVSEIDPETWNVVELLANQIIFANKPVFIHSIDKSELHRFPLRKLPKEGEKIRIVEVEGFDFSGCCGTHVLRSGEIGLIKLLRWEKYKNNIRVSFLCGLRALSHYRQTYQTQRQLCSLLSAAESELGLAAEQLQTDRKEQSRIIKDLKERLIQLEAKDLHSGADHTGDLARIVHCFENREPAELQALVREIVKEANSFVVLCLKNKNPFVVVGRSRDIEWDIRPFLKQACSLINGRGGGSADFGQAQGDTVEGLESILALGREVKIS